MTLWRSFLLHLFWCCSTIAALLLSQAIYPWIWIWGTRRGPPVYSTLQNLDEVCAPDNPDQLEVFSKLGRRLRLREMGEVEGEVGPMRVLGYFIAAAVYVALLLWAIDKRSPEVEAPPVPNEVRTRANNEVRLPRSAEPVMVVPAKTMDELCAGDRSKLASSDLEKCDILEKAKSELDDALKRLDGVAEIRTGK